MSFLQSQLSFKVSKVIWECDTSQRLSAVSLSLLCRNVLNWLNMTKHDIDTENDNKCMVSIGLKVNKDQDMKTVNMGQWGIAIRKTCS